MDEKELKARIPDYVWYHFIPLGGGLETPGVATHVQSQQKTLRAMARVDFQGKRVLDIGCRDGLFSFEAERRGAAEIVGIDNDLSPGATELLIPYLKSKVRMHQMNLMDLKRESFGAFDVVIFSGVLYHLRYPMWGIKLIRDAMVEGGTMILETAVFAGADRYPMLYCPTTDESPYGESAPTLFNMRGLRETLTNLGFEVIAHELQGNYPPPQGEFAPTSIDRVVLEARAVRDARKRRLVGYFEGTHDLHSTRKEGYE